MTAFEIIIGTIIGIQLTKDRLAKYHHLTERSEESQDIDEDLEASRQTRNLEEWLLKPESTDYIGVDDPIMACGWYDPSEEFD